METLIIINSALILLIIGLVTFLVKYYLPSYLKKKGENLAQKEDIAAITAEVESVKSEYNSRIERLKSELAKSAHVHKLQFETEFEAFRQIWERLLDVRNRTLSLRPIIDTKYPSEEENKKVRHERFKAFADSFDAFLALAEKNKPFYPQTIWHELDSFITIARKEGISFHYSDPEEYTKEYWDEALKHRDAILNGIDTICEAIRSRVDGLKNPS